MLVINILSLCLSTSSTAYVSGNAFHGTHHPKRHVPLRLQADPPPPELDERQAEFMRQRGFEWNPKARSWSKGDPARAQRLEVRSAGRVLKWEGNHELMSEVQLRAVKSATKRFQSTLREARDTAITSSDTDRRIGLKVKDTLARPYAPAMWLLLQASTLAFLMDTDVGWQLEPEGVGISMAIGAAFAPLVAILRSERWVRQPGVEDGDGALERLLVDAALGSYALPAPWEWRGSEPQWSAAIVLAEGLASVNMAFFWHGLVQAAIVQLCTDGLGDLAAAFVGVLVVAATSVLRAAYFCDPVLDGVHAEVAAAARLDANAAAYYSMTAAGEEEAAAVAAIRAMAHSWQSKFAVQTGAGFEQLIFTFTSAALCAVAWELGGRTAITPALTLALSAVGTYALSADPEMACVTLPLASLSTHASSVGQDDTR